MYVNMNVVGILSLISVILLLGILEGKGVYAPAHADRIKTKFPVEDKVGVGGDDVFFNINVIWVEGISDGNFKVYNNDDSNQQREQVMSIGELKAHITSMSSPKLVYLFFDGEYGSQVSPIHSWLIDKKIPMGYDGKWHGLI